MGIERARQFHRLKFRDPREVLVQFRRLELSPEWQGHQAPIRNLRARVLKPDDEMRTAILFCYGLGLHNGAHVIVGHGKVRQTVGIPGTGLSYTTTQSTGGAAEDDTGARPRSSIGSVLLWILAAIVLIPIPIPIGALATLFGKG